MYIKWNITGVIAFLLLGAVIYRFGPGAGAWWRILVTGALYAGLFFACFVVVKRR